MPITLSRETTRRLVALISAPAQRVAGRNTLT